MDLCFTNYTWFIVSKVLKSFFFFTAQRLWNVWKMFQKTLLPGSVQVNRNRKGGSILKDEVINQRAAGQVILSLYSLLILCVCVCVLWCSQSVEFVDSVQHLLWIGFFRVVNKCQSTYPNIILSFVFVKKKK